MGHYCDVCCFTTTTKCHRVVLFMVHLKNLVVVIKFELVVM